MWPTVVLICWYVTAAIATEQEQSEQSRYVLCTTLAIRMSTSLSWRNSQKKRITKTWKLEDTAEVLNSRTLLRYSGLILPQTCCLSFLLMARADVGGIDGGGFKGRLRVVTINVWSGSRYIGELSFGTWFSFKSYVRVRVRVEASTSRSEYA